MQKQRPPRGQAWPKAGVGPDSGVCSSICLVIWVFSFTEYIWSLSGSALRALNLVITLYKSIFFSVHSVFQRTSGLRPKKYIEFQFISVSNLWGRAPQNLLTIFFWFLEKILSPKNSNFFFHFGSKNYADRCNLVSGVRQNSFFVQKKFLKNFDFWT